MPSCAPASGLSAGPRLRSSTAAQTAYRSPSIHTPSGKPSHPAPPAHRLTRSHPLFLLNELLAADPRTETFALLSGSCKAVVRLRHLSWNVTFYICCHVIEACIHVPFCHISGHSSLQKISDFTYLVSYNAPHIIFTPYPEIKGFFSPQ